MVYKPHIVSELELFYGDLLFDFNAYTNVIDHLEALSARLFEGIQIQHEPLYIELNNYHKAYIGKTYEELKLYKITEADCHDVIAQEHGFENWEPLSRKIKLEYNPSFEHAINLLLAGKSKELKTLLQENPKLASERSPYGHQATLLHYAGSNGVEMWRQKVPLNLAELTNILLEAGADKNATMKVYGGNFTTLELLTTSAHPYQAGVVEELKIILES